MGGVRHGSGCTKCFSDYSLENLRTSHSQADIEKACQWCNPLNTLVDLRYACWSNEVFVQRLDGFTKGQGHDRGVMLLFGSFICRGSGVTRVIDPLVLLRS